MPPLTSSSSLLFLLYFALLCRSSPMNGVASTSSELSIVEVYTDGPVLPEGNNLKIRTPEPHPDDTDFYYTVTLGGDADNLVLVTYPEWDNSDLNMIESRLAEVDKNIGCFKDTDDRVWVVGTMPRGSNPREASSELVKMFESRESIQIVKILFEGPHMDFDEGSSVEVRQRKEFDEDATWEYAEVGEGTVFVRCLDWTVDDLGEIRNRFQEAEESMGCFEDDDENIWVAAEIPTDEPVEDAAFGIVKMFDLVSDSEGSSMDTD